MSMFVTVKHLSLVQFDSISPLGHLLLLKLLMIKRFQNENLESHDHLM
jgi:hypothetical protein